MPYHRIYMESKESYLQVMSDVYKEAYGVRPRHVNYHEWTLKELKSEFVKLRKIIDV